MYFENIFRLYILKVECVVPVIIISILPHADFGQNDHQEGTAHFIKHGSDASMSNQLVCRHGSSEPKYTMGTWRIGTLLLDRQWSLFN